MKNVASSWLSRLTGLIATPLTPAHYLGLLRPLAANHTARVEAVTRETADVTTLTLRPGRGWTGHQAGQHVRVALAIDGRITARMYSISSSPERADGLITITVKAQGRVSNALCSLAPGSYLTLGTPEGDFVAPTSERVLFVTGGSGITPVISMLRTYAARGEMPDVVHLHFARSADDVIFAGDLFDLAANHASYHSIIVTDRRRFTPDLVPDWSTREVLACGPASLLEAVAPLNARVERFAAVLATPSDASGGHVRFGTSRVSAISDGRTPLLRIAESAGVAAPHGCRMGICHTCDATLTKGCVRDLRTGDRIDAGARIQICVCAAAGDVELAL